MPPTMSGTPSPSRATSSAAPLCVLIIRLVAAALVSSFIMGALATSFQYIRVVPLILDAEAFEVAEPPNPNATHDHNEGLAHDHGLTNDHSHADNDEEWAPADGAERGGFTLLSNFIVSLGFSLLILGISVLHQEHVSMRSGLQRGVAGWVIFMAGPCVGLSPELPGMAAAALVDRQWWWVYSVAFGTAGFGIALLASCVPPPPKPASADSGKAANQRTIDALRHSALQATILAVAVVVAVIPHLTGAPHPHTTGQEIETATTCGASHVACERAGPPSEMAAAFAVWCLATAFAYWVCLGVVCASAYNLAMGFEAPVPGEVSPTIELAEASVSTTDAI